MCGSKKRVVGLLLMVGLQTAAKDADLACVDTITIPGYPPFLRAILPGEVNARVTVGPGGKARDVTVRTTAPLLGSSARRII